MRSSLTVHRPIPPAINPSVDQSMRLISSRCRSPEPKRTAVAIRATIADEVPWIGPVNQAATVAKNKSIKRRPRRSGTISGISGNSVKPRSWKRAVRSRVPAIIRPNARGSANTIQSRKVTHTLLDTAAIAIAFGPVPMGVAMPPKLAPMAIPMSVARRKRLALGVPSNNG